jgi:hypothetical protein
MYKRFSVEVIQSQKLAHETGSRIPSISTGGAAINAMMNTEVAVSSVGIINTPNHPMYKRLEP